ncbi:MAG: lipase maturation factor family protein, partial [Verrucomicrobiota bacterium]|nr:lipase maturation factor family protein [Verrucomicrobiota bacterium]
MIDSARRRVASPPVRPLVLFDGDCHFCRRWIERWKEKTAGAVDYAAAQDAGARFPEIPADAFERSVQLIDPRGEVFSGAEAVFRALSYREEGIAWLSFYHRVPVFAAIAETAYRLVSTHRAAASTATRFLWGNDVRKPTYVVTRSWFLRALALVYFIAFISLWVQIDGLVGRNGILPVSQFLSAAREQIGSAAPAALPTLCWLNSSDGFLHFLCGGGAALSLLLFAEVAPVLVLTALFVFYLSLTIAGQTFLSFQWDILLLETGFLAIFFAPFQWIPSRNRSVPVSRIGLFLLKLLLFKLMVMSAVVKLTSGDSSWWDLTALNYHYETQPLPTVLAWWAHQGGRGMKAVSTLAMFFVELVVPVFIWAPRRLRVAAAVLLGSLQIAIAATGNY